jgi:hypothetical protein
MYMTSVFIFLGLVAAHGVWRMAGHNEPSIVRHLRGACVDIPFHVRARLCLWVAKAKAKAACAALIDQQLDDAEELLDQSRAWLRRAGDGLDVLPAYAQRLDAIRYILRGAMVGLRAQAQLTMCKMDRLLAEGSQSASPARAATNGVAAVHVPSSPLSTGFNPSNLRAACEGLET